jgi:hypothetical protein
MAFTRTRIWHGGNTPRDPEEPGSVPLTPVPESPGREGARQAPEQRFSDQAPSADYIPGFAPGAAREQVATRFMPIEELFPDVAADPAAHEPPSRASARRPSRALVETPTGLRGGSRARARRWPILVLALASLVLGATLWSHDVRRQLGAGLARAGAAVRQAKPTADSAPRAGAAHEAAEAAPVPATAPQSPTQRTPTPRAESAPGPGLERAAIDALIAGDFARAEKLYARLARGSPPEPIREALRILSSRHATRSP